MSKHVQRFVVTAHPTDKHPKYYRWQTGTLCLFVGEDDKAVAVKKAKSQITKNNWVAIRFTDKATLIEERVRQVGGKVWEAYLQAQRGEIFFLDSVDQLTSGKQKLPPPLAPRVTETFIDHVITRAGGHRLTKQEANNEKSRNADYLIDDYVFELKTLEEEGLEKENRQKKLANLFRDAPSPRGSVSLDPSILPEAKRREYMDIVGGPIKTHIRSASDQIKKTKAHLRNAKLHGGVILLNTGYGSLPSKIFEQLVERYAKKDSRQIDSVACISVWLKTNGFDTNMVFKFYPKNSTNHTVEKIGKAFMEYVNEWMTEFARSGFTPKGLVTDPLKPIAFEQDGIIFSTVPLQIPDTRFG